MRLVAIALAAGLAIGAGGAWRVQAWRYDGEIANIHAASATALIEVVKATRAEEQEHYARLQESERQARERELEQRAAVQRALAESRGLRDDLSRVRASLPALTDAAVRERANTLGGLLGDCSERYQSMAEKAQRHAADVTRLLGAWPRNLIE